MPSMRRSLHIGLNQVDRASYGWNQDLRACEADALAMADVARSRGFDPTVLLTRDATLGAVTAEIRQAAAELESGGFFFVTFAGHGGQVPDLDADEATQSGDLPDMLDETWLLYDSQIVDDEIFAALSAFAPGVWIFLLSDSCHSGTVSRDSIIGRRQAAQAISAGGPAVRWAPVDVTFAEFRAHRQAYENRLGAATVSALPDSHVNVVLISGCQDDQTSSDGSAHGLFTQEFLTVWARGSFSDYRQLYDAIKARMPRTQQPNLFAYGAGVDDMLRTMPLTALSN